MITLNKDEKIVLKLRRHKFTLIMETIFLSIFVCVPPLLYILSDNLISIRGNELALFTTIYSVILLIAWMIFYTIWTNYFLDILIVTDRRIIDIEQKGFFNRELSTLRLDRIQDVTVTITGIIATFLNYGTIRIQTAGEAREFIVKAIPEPNNVKAIIFDLHNKQLEAPQSVKMVE